MSDETRVGARPLSAFHTVAILVPTDDMNDHDDDVNDDDEHDNADKKHIPMGISPRRTTHGSHVPLHDNDYYYEEHDGRAVSPHDSILMQDDVLGLLQDEHADPPLETPVHLHRSISEDRSEPPLLSDDDHDDDDDADQYHSPRQDPDHEHERQQQQHESEQQQQDNDNHDPTPRWTASPYDYDVNWDMVGQLRHQQQPPHPPQHTNNVNDDVITSLAEVAAASAIVSNSSSEPHESTLTESTKPNQKRAILYARPTRRSLHPPHQYSYKYQRYTPEQQQSPPKAQDMDEEDHVDIDIHDDLDMEDTGYHSTFTLPTPTIVDLPPSQTATETASEMNESINTTSNSSSSSGSSTARRRRVHQRWFPRTSSAPTEAVSPSTTLRERRTSAARPTTPTMTEDTTTSGLMTSLDTGMAAVRRWIRSRTTTATTPRSSRAARIFQREHNVNDISTLRLGEEDLFALTHAGEDPRGRQHHDDSDFFHSLRSSHLYPPSILEEEGIGEDGSISPFSRQRALSEPDGMRIRDFFFQRAARDPSSQQQRPFRSRRSRGDPELGESEGSTNGSVNGTALSVTSSSVPAHLSSAALSSSLFHSPQRPLARSLSVEQQQQQLAQDNDGDAMSQERGDGDSIAEMSLSPAAVAEETAPTRSGSRNTQASPPAGEPDPYREARTRWLRINRRFQIVITIVALIFSLLLFAILVCWVVLTSAYVVAIDKKCDVPLKSYFWLATLQLILDVFRSDIMRFVFQWDASSTERIPVRVIIYNFAYLIYAMLVLRLGVRSVFLEDSTCSTTAHELYQSSAVFVSLSLAAWSTIVLGYLVPFCFVATLLTWNGYTPARDINRERAGVQVPGSFGGVFPVAYSNAGAPPGCIDELRTVLLEEFPEDYPHECCICMGDFAPGEVIVATECEHVFHKRCCQEWLRQARTCPVCRTDIPSSLPSSNTTVEGNDRPDDAVAPAVNRFERALRPTNGPFPGREDFHQDLVQLLQVLRRQEERMRHRTNAGDETHDTAETVVRGSRRRDPSPLRSESLPARMETEMVALEEGRVNRQHSG